MNLKKSLTPDFTMGIVCPKCDDVLCANETSWNKCDFVQCGTCGNFLKWNPDHYPSDGDFPFGKVSVYVVPEGEGADMSDLKQDEKMYIETITEDLFRKITTPPFNLILTKEEIAYALEDMYRAGRSAGINIGYKNGREVTTIEFNQVAMEFAKLPYDRRINVLDMMKEELERLEEPE